MPADRLLHPKSSQSHKVSQLTDLQFRVWIQYLLSADDFGVMQATAARLQADNRYLRTRPAKLLLRSIEALVLCGLLRRFEHQELPFVYSHNWQTWQKVEYPRTTNEPKPPTVSIDDCDELTRQLFGIHPGGVRGKFRKRLENSSGVFSEDSVNVQETFSPTRAGAPAKRLTANGSRLTANGSEEKLDVAFREFQAAYPEHRRKGGHLLETIYVDQCHKAGGPEVLMAALVNHLASAQWADSSLVPGMGIWLSEERWRQTLPPPVVEKKPGKWDNWTPREVRK